MNTQMSNFEWKIHQFSSCSKDRLCPFYIHQAAKANWPFVAAWHLIGAHQLYL
jgi:hypothetical protein